MRWRGVAGRGREGDRIARWIAVGLVGAVAVAIWIARGVTASPSEMQLFIGRLHPLIVHLPIGFVLFAVALEGLSRTRRFVRLRHAVPLALVMSALSAIAAVLAGMLLARSGGYAGDLVGWHERLGIAVAAGSVLALILHHLHATRGGRGLRLAYSASMAATVAVLLAAGHLGGTLTRGPDYLTEYMPGPLLAVSGLLSRDAPAPAAPFAYPEEARIYEHLVAPVLTARCVSCHGPQKQNGDLRLDSPEVIAAGGTSGPVLVAGRAGESPLVARTWLPPEHDDIMPPRGRQPLSAAEAELLRWWVDRGASFDDVVGRATPPPGVLAILEQIAGPPEARVPAVLRTDIPPADSSAVAAARASGWLVRPIAEGSNFLRASCVDAADPCGPDRLGVLPGLAAQITELDLSGADIGDADLPPISGLPHLTSLSLDGTGLSDAGLGHLSGLEHLEYLNLYDTSVTDAGLAALEPLSRLRALYLWRTGVTAGGARALAERLPGVTVNLGTDSATIDSPGAEAGW